MAAVEEEGAAANKPSGTRLGRKVTAWFAPSHNSGAPETVPSPPAASARTSMSSVAETGFAAGGGDAETVRPKRRSTVWEMMSGSSTPSASGDASALPGAVSLGGDADGDDVFDLDGGDADFGDEDEVLDLDSLADAS